MDKISAVLIMKNEEVMLPRVLDSLKGVDEIILCDTGSVDKTLEIAKQYTDKIYHFPWEDHFAKARNYAKSFATGNWIISIDCDEFLDDVENVRTAVSAAEQQGALAVNVKLVSDDHKQEVFYFPRLFKNSPQVWWEGAIHNHISVTGITTGEVKITFGYSPAHQLDKNRAFRILKKEVEATGNGREMFYLGREYWYQKDYDNALKIFGRYVQQSRYLPEKAEAFLTMAKCYWDLKMADDARDACVQALLINPHFKEAVLFMSMLAGDGSGNETWQANADQWKHMSETANNSNVLFIRNV